MRMSAETKREREATKKKLWGDELERLRKRQLQSVTSERYEKAKTDGRNQVEQIRAYMYGQEFSDWYEATTGTPVEPFLSDIWERPRYEKVAGTDFLDYLKGRIEYISDSNRWSNPEMQVFMVKALVNEKRYWKRREIMVRLATPRWVDREKILKIYQQRTRLSVQTGIEHEVDHIVPIVHALVCGLHCEANLQIIPASENRMKSNKFEIHDPI